MIDSHLHLDDERLIQQVDQMVAEFESKNVEFVINNSADLAGMIASYKLANQYEKVFATVGMHPHTAKDFDQNFVNLMVDYAKHPKVVAVGEIGLDYYYDLSERNIQRDVFAEQIEIADKLGLPITLHIRDAYGDAMDVLTAQKRYLNNNVLWHCYSGSAEFAKQCAKLGHYFAFGGAITFKNAKKEDIIKNIPIERVMCETDCPYMSPVPYRGQVNEPKRVAIVYQAMADIYEISLQKFIKQVAENAVKFFGEEQLGN